MLCKPGPEQNAAGSCLETENDRLAERLCGVAEESGMHRLYAAVSFYYQACVVVVEQARPSATLLTGNIFRFLFSGCL